jgi:hypothetical protein
MLRFCTAPVTTCRDAALMPLLTAGSELPSALETSVHEAIIDDITYREVSIIDVMQRIEIHHKNE